jgi:hypothetical protein
LVLVALFIEVGLLLIVLPWSRFWERNYFFEAVPMLEVALTNYYARGAISGLGVLNLLAGFAEMIPLFAVRARHNVLGDEADTQVRS